MMADPTDLDEWMADWRQQRAWQQAKAKEASRLTEEEIAFLDRAFAQRIRERLEQQAATSWWALFGSLGHSLETLEHEARFVRELDRVFIYPSASSLLSPAIEKRKSYTVQYLSKQAERTTGTFIAPPPSRLLELMLFGFFRYRGRWIYLSREKGKTSQNYRHPSEWMALDPTERPIERLGLTVTINTNQGRQTAPPNAVFSSLSESKRVALSRECGLPGSHQEWLQSIADNAFKPRPRDQTISILLAGQYRTTGLPLAELIANGGHIPGKKVESTDGNLFDLRPQNLCTKSSRGRKMICNSCRRPTSAIESKRIKDSTGSTFRFCNACEAWALRNSKAAKDPHREQ